MVNFEVVFAGIELLTFPHVNLVNCTGNYTPQRCGGQLFEHHPYLWHLEDQADFIGEWSKVVHGPVCGVPLNELDLYFEAPGGLSGSAWQIDDIPSTQDFDHNFSRLVDRTPGPKNPVIARVQLVGGVGTLASALVGTNTTGVKTLWTSTKSGYNNRPLAEALVWRGEADHLELKIDDQRYIKFESQSEEPILLAITNLPKAVRSEKYSEPQLEHFQMYYELFEDDLGACGYPVAVDDPSYLKPLNIGGWLQGGVLGSSGGSVLRYQGYRADGGGALCPPSKFP